MFDSVKFPNFQFPFVKYMARISFDNSFFKSNHNLIRFHPRSVFTQLQNQFRRDEFSNRGLLPSVCAASGEQRYHPSRRLVAVQRAVVSRFCITEVRTVANGPLANSSSCQRRSNHQNIIGVSEERPKQRALSSIRESLSRVNAISLRYPVDRYRLLRPLSLSLSVSPSICLFLSCPSSTAHVAQHAR